MTWLWILLAVIVVVGILGFGGILGAAAAILEVAFWVLLAIFVIGLIVGLVTRRSVTSAV